MRLQNFQEESENMKTVVSFGFPILYHLACDFDILVDQDILTTKKIISMDKENTFNSLTQMQSKILPLCHFSICL